jgi:NTP pyrophosphatase (non-canonical NTP hydrolase)
MDDATWTTLGRLRRDFLGGLDQPVLMLKLQEEVGEAAEAFIGAGGYNPRKGVCKTVEDVRKELSDVIITAGVALIAVTGDDHEKAAEAFQASLARVAERSGVAPP